MKRKFDFYLRDILEAVERIQNYTEELSFEDFTGDNITIDAVLRNLEVIGEAASQVPAEVREKYKNIPWRDIQDFRIVVAHHYWKVNQKIVWDIVENKLGTLRKQVEIIIKEIS